MALYNGYGFNTVIFYWIFLFAGASQFHAGGKHEFNNQRSTWYKTQKKNRTALYIEWEEKAKRINAQVAGNLTEEDRSFKEKQLLKRYHATVSTFKQTFINIITRLI